MVLGKHSSISLKDWAALSPVKNNLQVNVDTFNNCDSVATFEAAQDPRF